MCLVIYTQPWWLQRNEHQSGGFISNLEQEVHVVTSQGVGCENIAFWQTNKGASKETDCQSGKSIIVLYL